MVAVQKYKQGIRFFIRLVKDNKLTHIFYTNTLNSMTFLWIPCLACCYIVEQLSLFYRAITFVLLCLIYASWVISNTIFIIIINIDESDYSHV